MALAVPAPGQPLHPWQHVVNAVETMKHLGLVALIALVIFVIFDWWHVAKAQLIERALEAKAASTPQAPSAVPIERKTGLFHLGGGTNKPAQSEDRSHPAAVPAPPSVQREAQEQGKVAPLACPALPDRYLFSEKRDRDAVEAKYGRSLDTYDLLGEVTEEKMPPMRYGGSMAMFWPRRGFVEPVFKVNERPRVSFAQSFAAAAGFTWQSQVARGLVAHDVGATFGLAWRPVRVLDWRLRIAADADFVGGRVPYRVTASAERWWGREE